MARTRHPNQEIETALQHAENNGWRVETGSGHCWGRICCPENNKSCRNGMHCITSIWSTPRNASNHARQLRRIVDNYIFMSDDDE